MIAKQQINGLLQRKRDALERSKSPQIKAAIKSEILILELYQEETQEETDRLTKALAIAQASESTLIDICTIHGIDLQLWAMKLPDTIRQEAQEAINKGYITIPSSVKKILLKNG